MALFYYAGHAMQHQGVNYLMPIDANLIERGRPAPHDQAQRHRVGREARQGAAHHGDRRLPRQSARPKSSTADRKSRRRARPAAPGSPSSPAPWRRPRRRTPSRSTAAATSSSMRRKPAAPPPTASGATARSPAAFVKYVETEGQEVVVADAPHHDQRAGGDEGRAAARALARGAVRVLFQARPAAAAADRAAARCPTRSRTRSVRSRPRSRRSCRRSPQKDREQARRELMVLLSDIASALRPEAGPDRAGACRRPSPG